MRYNLLKHSFEESLLALPAAGSLSIAPPLLSSYGMWRPALAASLLCVAIRAAVFTEGGSVGSDFPLQNNDYDYAKTGEYMDAEQLAKFEEQLRELSEAEKEEEAAREARAADEEYKVQLEAVLREMAKQEQENTIGKDFPVPAEMELEMHKPAKQVEQVEAPSETLQKQPLVAQKKGQNEFVSFVEPVEAKQTKAIPTLEKRRLATSAEYSSAMPKYSSNLLMIAVGTVLMVGIVGTVIGGGVYLKRRRETPDDGEYAPYAGTGPNFNKKNKGDKGDESLAYKAQLHHYQQAKQKIICGDEAPGVMESDGEDDGADDENNFSVYECPGLAPTGDIEVCNPNFAAQP